VKFQLFDTLSVAAVISYFVPLALVLFKKLWRDPFFMLFAAYWALGGLINMADVVPGVSKKFSYTLGVFYNMLDVPFILGILYCTSSSPLIKKFTPFAIVLILSSEVFSLITNGITYDALKYPLGAGIATVLFIVIMEIVRYMQKIEHTNRQNAKMFIYAAVLFEYATFIVIYIFDYFVPAENPTDSYLIYYMSSMVAILIASCGYLLFRKYEKANNQWPMANG
jgi:hypothetical protein